MKTLTVTHLSFKTDYELYAFTGKVVGTNKRSETHVYGGGGGGATYRGTGGSAPVSISSHTTVHDDLYLQDEAGGERSYQLSDFNVACREGHELTVIHAIKKGDSRGPYIVVRNHTTATTFFDDKVMADMFRIRWRYLLLGILVLPFVSSIIGGLLSVIFPASIIKYLGLATIVAWVIYWFYFNLTLTPMKRFKNETNFNAFRND